MVMFRGKVTGVDDKGCYVLVAALDAVSPQGPLAWTGVTPKVGDPVLLADTGDGASPDLVVVGVLNSATGGTDNAVARFDGTGGALQGSGVTIDDGNNIVTKGTFVSGNGATASNHITVDSPKDTANADLGFRANGVNRWTIRRTADTESGSDAGSNLEIMRRNDAGTLLGAALVIFRQTGRIRIGTPGSTAGLEFGASGPTITTGTGAPSHIAPNGSVYQRQDGTASTTLYVRAAGSWSALS